MKSTRKICSFTSTSPSSPSTATNTEIPVDSSQPNPIPIITVHPPTPNSTSNSSAAAAAAAKIQASYRSYVIRNLIRKISSVKKETDRLQRLIQRQETVDTLRSHTDEGNKLKVRMNEELMKELLKLDGVPGFDPVVRKQRKWMSRRIVGLQEVLDWVCGGVEAGGWNDDEMLSWRSGWDWDEVIGGMSRRIVGLQEVLDWVCGGVEAGGWNDDEMLSWRSGWDWDEVIGGIEGEVCRERGGDELDKFCVEKLGFRCLERFLRES